MAQLVKTVQGLAIASVKTVQGLAIASVKTINGLDNTSTGGTTLDDFAGLIAWYQTPISGSTNGNTTGWEDSKNSYDLTHFIAAPIYRTNQINSYDTVDFEGTKDLNNGTRFPTDAYPITYVLVAKFVASGNLQGLIYSTTGGADLRTEASAGSEYLNADKAGTSNIGTGNVAVSAGWHVLMCVLTSTTYAFWIDGSGAGNGSHSVTLDSGKIGGLSNFAFPWADEIVEVGIYQADRTSDATAIKNAMFTKYAL